MPLSLRTDVRGGKDTVLSGRRAIRTILAAVLSALAFTSAATPAHAASAPADFTGLGDWAWPSEKTLAEQSASGLRSWRVGFVWDWVEHTPGRLAWGGYDDLVANAAKNRVSLLFAINGCAAWACGQTRTAPQTPEQHAAFQAFMTKAVQRYGAGGSFWAERPSLTPVSISWQVWNEVNVGQDWIKPTAADYQSFLSATSKTIKSVDPSATVVTSGLAEFPANSDGATMTTFLTALERDPAFRSSADVVALHGYAANPAGLVRILDRARSIMRAAGDERPIWITELGWASGGPAHPFVSDQGTQAQYLRDAYDTMVACRSRWNLQRAMWFSYSDIAPAALGEGDYWGMHTGLRQADGAAKPVMDAFAEYVGGRDIPGGRGERCQLEGGTTPPPPATDPGTEAAPTVTITRAPTLIGANTRAPRVDFVTSMGNAGNAECSTDNQNWTLCATPYRMANDREGTTTLWVRAVSPSGVRGPAASTTWTVDLTAPTTVFKKRPPKRSTSRAVKVRLGVAGSGARLGADSEGVSFQCQLNRGKWKACKSNGRVTAPRAGKQLLRIRAVDAAGNVDPRGAQARFVVTRR